MVAVAFHPSPKLNPADTAGAPVCAAQNGGGAFPARVICYISLQH